MLCERCNKATNGRSGISIIGVNKATNKPSTYDWVLCNDCCVQMKEYMKTFLDSLCKSNLNQVPSLLVEIGDSFEDKKNHRWRIYEKDLQLVKRKIEDWIHSNSF